MSDAEHSPPPDETAEEPEVPSSRRAIVASLAVGALLVAGVLGAALLLQEDGAADSPGTSGLAPVSGPDSRPLPSAELAAFHGEGSVRLADYRGTPLVLNFWASWCAPCVEEMPDFQEFADQAAGRVRVLGVNVQDNHEQARGFVDELDITYDLARDPTADFYASMRGIAMPTTLFVDEAGIVRYRHAGPLDADRLRQLLAEHLRVDLPEPGVTG